MNNDATSLRQALVKFYVKNASNICPDRLYSNMMLNHPSLEERIDALKGFGNEQKKKDIESNGL